MSIAGLAGLVAIGLARAAIEAGHRVYFITAADLAKRCRRAALEGRWATAMGFYCGPRLLVIDEFAYARHKPDREANAALFEVISRHYLKSSTIVTGHAGVASWGERLGDPMLAASLLDRLLHRGVVVAIDGPSYRMRSDRLDGAGRHAATARVRRPSTPAHRSRPTGRALEPEPTHPGGGESPSPPVSSCQRRGQD